MNAFLFDILGNFWLDSDPVSCEVFGSGHVNKTYLATTVTGHRYILQMIGPAFKMCMPCRTTSLLLRTICTARHRKSMVL